MEFVVRPVAAHHQKYGLLQSAGGKIDACLLLRPIHRRMPAAGYDTDDPFPVIRLFGGAEDADGLADRTLARPETFGNEVTHDSGVAGVVHVFFVHPSPL